jgi:hypothetical protein
MDSKYDFFIAYASPDRGAAEELSWQLQDLDRIVFFDKAGLDLGAAWDEELLDALGRSRVVVVLVSRNTRRAHYEREEVARAIKVARADDGVRVVPVILPGAEDSNVPYGLSIIQGVDGRLSGGMRRAAVSLHDAFPPSDPSDTQPYLNAYYALGAALRLDRIPRSDQAMG